MKIFYFILFALLASNVSFGQTKAFAFVVQDDSYPFHRPLTTLVTGIQNQIAFTDFGPNLIHVSVQNGKFDSLQINPDDPFTYYLTPTEVGKLTLITIRKKKGSGQNTLINDTSYFEAIKPPLVEVQLSNNFLISPKTIRFKLIDRETGKKLSKRYRIGHYYNIYQLNEQGEQIGIASMQSSSLISLANFKNTAGKKEGIILKFSVPIRDYKTGILFYTQESNLKVRR